VGIPGHEWRAGLRRVAPDTGLGLSAVRIRFVEEGAEQDKPIDNVGWAVGVYIAGGKFVGTAFDDYVSAG
jgi:hypothetical protein